MKMGYDEYFKETQLTGKWVSYCGVKCGKSQQEAVDKLQVYLELMRDKAIKEFNAYNLKEQIAIGAQGGTNIIPDENGLAIGIKETYTVKPPTPFEPPKCIQ